MKSKEEILDDHTKVLSIKVPKVYETQVLAAMEEYAQHQLAPSGKYSAEFIVLFVDWLFQSGWKRSEAFGFFDPNENHPKFYSTREIIDLFSAVYYKPQPAERAAQTDEWTNEEMLQVADTSLKKDWTDEDMNTIARQSFQAGKTDVATDDDCDHDITDTWDGYYHCLCCQRSWPKKITPELNELTGKDDMTVEEFYSGFNLDFLSEEEKQTIYTATNLFAKGKVRQSFPLDLLVELEEYFEKRQDADWEGEETGLVPNKEMQFYGQIKELLEK